MSNYHTIRFMICCVHSRKSWWCEIKIETGKLNEKKVKCKFETQVLTQLVMNLHITKTRNCNYASYKLYYPKIRYFAINFPIYIWHTFNLYVTNFMICHLRENTKHNYEPNFWDPGVYYIIFHSLAKTLDTFILFCSHFKTVSFCMSL